MKLKVLSGLVALGMLSAAGLGCGDDTTATGGNGTGGNPTTGGNGAGGMPVTTTVGGGGAGGAAGDGNDTIDTAETLDFSMGFVEVDSDLTTPTEDVDFYAFDGTAGQKVAFVVSAHPSGTDLQSADYVDAVVTLYGPSKQKIAFNDDPFPRGGQQDSELFTVLPEAGTYYVSVEDYHHFDPASGTDAVLDPAFKLTIADLSVQGFFQPEAEPNNDAASATAITLDDTITYKVISPDFDNGTDVDWFEITVPAYSVDPFSRQSLYFTFAPGTVDGSGATVELGKVQLIDSATMAVVAEVDPSTEAGDKSSSILWEREMIAPVTQGSTYFLKVNRTGTAGANDFYYVKFFPDVDSNPLETETAGQNDTFGTAETLTVDTSNPDFPRYFVEGDLAAGDVDNFKVAVPAGFAQVFYTCSSAGRGGGLRDLTGELFDVSGAALPATSSTETESNDPMNPFFAATVDAIDVPASGGSLTLQITNTMQDPVVAGTFYSCAVVFFNP